MPFDAAGTCRLSLTAVITDGVFPGESHSKTGIFRLGTSYAWGIFATLSFKNGNGFAVFKQPFKYDMNNDARGEHKWVARA